GISITPLAQSRAGAERQAQRVCCTAGCLFTFRKSASTPIRSIFRPACSAPLAAATPGTHVRARPQAASLPRDPCDGLSAQALQHDIFLAVVTPSDDPDSARFLG